MAVTPTHIPTEILRLLTAQEAAEYRLVPFAREAGRIRCYGETGHDYTAAAEELEVLYGWQVEVVPIAADDLQRLLLQHYRPGAQTASAAAGRTAEIGQGRQFLFALVGEAIVFFALESWNTANRKDPTIVITRQGMKQIRAARRAKRKGVPAVAIVGIVGPGIEPVYDEGITAVFTTNREALPFEAIRGRGAEDYRRALVDLLRYTKIFDR